MDTLFSKIKMRSSDYYHNGLKRLGLLPTSAENELLQKLFDCFLTTGLLTVNLLLAKVGEENYPGDTLQKWPMF